MARGTQGAELSVKEMETVGVGGCQGRGHSDDMGVTSWGSRNNHDVRSRYYGEKKSSPATAQQGVRTLNRHGNHKCLMNPVSTVVWFSPAVGLTRECSTEVLRWCMTHGT